MTMHSRLHIIACLTIGLLACITRSWSAEYVIVDLGTISGPDETTAPGSSGLAINADNVVAGYSIASDVMRNVHAIRWSDGDLSDLLPFGIAIHSQGFAINDAGIVVGTSYVLGDLEPNAVRWVDTTPEAIGHFVARDINNAGLIVGERAVAPWYVHRQAVAWESGSLTELPTLGGASAGAYATDSDGRIAGKSTLPDGLTFHACFWQAGSVTDLGTLGGPRSEAVDMNDLGQIVGFAENSAGTPRATVFLVDGAGNVVSRTDLGAFDDGYSFAFGINNNGVVVGSSDSRASVWDNHGMRDLHELVPAESGWELMMATAVNDNGSIVGMGKHFGLPRGFLARPRKTGDVDANGTVNLFDLLGLLSQWGTCPGDCPPSCDADFNDDCQVNLFDLLDLLNNWG